METLRRIVAIGLVVAVAAACREANTDSTPEAVTRPNSQAASVDSSLLQTPSITTREGVETDGPRWAPGEEWHISEQALVQIGELDGPEALGSVGSSNVPFPSGGVALLSEGRIAIADGRANEIRVYDAEGKRLSTVGCAGPGPGEFRGLQGIKTFAADSLLAWDTYPGTPFFIGRLSVFTTAGAFVRTIPTEARWFGALVGVTDAGTVLVEPSRSTPAGWTRPNEGQYREPRLYERIAASGMSLGPLGPVLGREWAEFGGGQRSFVYFGRDTELAVGKKAIYVGDGDEFTITVYDPEAGNAVRTVRRPYDPWPVTREELAARKEVARDSKRRSEAFYAERGVAPLRFIADPDEVPARETWPVMSRMVEDSDENLWVAHFRTVSDSAQAWSVFDRAGSWLGEVLIPNGLFVQAIADDRIAFVRRGEFGVQYVLVYGLLK